MLRFFNSHNLKDIKLKKVLKNKYFIFLGSFVLLLIFLCSLGLFLIEYPEESLDPANRASLNFYDSNGLLLRQETKEGELKENHVPLKKISSHLVNATLASEDKNFYKHAGVDWFAFLRSMWLNVLSKKFAYGGSTITMQLVRLTKPIPRTVTGKIHQIFLALSLERKFSKEQILEQYLNRVYYGNGVYGAYGAANFYFERVPLNLSLAEGALLAVIPRSPARYNPFENYEYMEQRRRVILSLMHKNEFINEKELQIAKDSPLKLSRIGTNFYAPHFVYFAHERLPLEFRKGAKVKTTLDLELQKKMEQSVLLHVDKLADRNLTQAAILIVRNSDGAILSMVGSKNYFDKTNKGAFNAVTAVQRPGSTLKPFVYGVALEKGDTPATIAYDVILPSDAHQLYTVDVRSHGYATYRAALASSFNLSAVHTLQRVGIKPVLEKMRKAGIATLDKPDDEYGWELAIGHAQMRLLDLVTAYTFLGREGRAIMPRAIDEAVLLDQSRWAEEPRETDRVFSKEITYLLFDILSDTEARRPMFGDSASLKLPFKIALKSGTTRAHTDLWAIGVTKEYTVGVWAGNFDGDPTHTINSAVGATPLIGKAYEAIAALYGPPTSPTEPSGLEIRSICPVSGMALGPHCQNLKKEIFLKGTFSQEPCNWHQKKCDEVIVTYPEQLRAWADVFKTSSAGQCADDNKDQRLKILSPSNKSSFILEPYRPAEVQKPILRATFGGKNLVWTINGILADDWVPEPGEYTVKVTDGNSTDSVIIYYLK